MLQERKVYEHDARLSVSDMFLSVSKQLNRPQLTLFDMDFFEPSVTGGGGGGMRAPHLNFVVIALMIMKFGTGIKLNVFYIMVTKKF